MLRRPPRSTRTDTLFPYTTLFRSSVKVCCSSVPFGITELLMAAPLPYPALVASHAGNWIAFPGGETRAVGRGEGIARAADTPVILLNAPLTAARLGYPELSGLDLLELYAFIHPARFAVDRKSTRLNSSH